MQSFQTHVDVMGKNTSVISISDYTLALVPSPGIAKTVTVPPDGRVVLFSATGNFWLRDGSAPAIPATDVLDGTAPELNPTGRTVKPGQILGLAAPAACTVCLSFFG